MAWQLRDPLFRKAIHDAVARMEGRCALCGTVGVQVHLAAAVGLDRVGPPAHAIEVVAFEGAVPPHDLGVPVEVVDAFGFDASVAAARSMLRVDGEEFLVASPEHILGLRLATPELPVDAKWACFVLMRVYEGRLDLEEARNILKRCESAERQALLAELAYLAA
jgi:hypothetical protein